MASQVWIRQGAEGRKIIINLTREQLGSLETGQSIQLVAGETPWSEDLTSRNDEDQPLAIVEIFIDTQGWHSQDW